MDANHLLDYLGENDECSKIQSLKEIVVNMIWSNRWCCRDVEADGVDEVE